jgi:hypothetical protein
MRITSCFNRQPTAAYPGSGPSIGDAGHDPILTQEIQITQLRFSFQDLKNVAVCYLLSQLDLVFKIF